MTPIPTAALRRILVRCPNWIGDTVMATPTLRALRRGCPGAEVLLLGPWAGQLLEAEQIADRILSFPRRRGERLRQLRALRREGVDLALLLPNSFGSALEAWLAGARFRIGYAADGRGLLLSHPLPRASSPVHQVEAYLRLLEPLGLGAAERAPALRVRPDRAAEAERLLAERGVVAGEPLVGIQLGSAFGPSKLWPAERYAHLADRLLADGLPVLFLGSPREAPLYAAIRREMAKAPLCLVGEDHPALLPALCSRLTVLVAGDTGPTQVAAACEVPVVTLFGPTDPRLTAPLGPRHAVVWKAPPCAPCFTPHCPIDHRCMTAITVEEIYLAVRERLGGRA